MNFASFTAASAAPRLAPLQSLVRFFFAPPAPRTLLSLKKRRVCQPAFLRKNVVRHDLGTGPIAKPIDVIQLPGIKGTPSFDAPQFALPSNRKGLPTLRVMRLLEAGQPSKSVGRMVISGRMADVCAELDRLVCSEQVLGEQAMH